MADKSTDAFDSQVEEGRAPLSDTPAQIDEQVAAILDVVRAIRQAQELQTKKINSIMSEVDHILRDL